MRGENEDLIPRWMLKLGGRWGHSDYVIIIQDLFLVLQPYQIRIWIRRGRVVWDLEVISVNDHNYSKFSTLKPHISRSSLSRYSEQLASFYISALRKRTTLQQI